MFHPDKHLDPDSKKMAEIMFNRTKRAYEVLSDPQQRAIYDSVGEKGLRTEGGRLLQSLHGNVVLADINSTILLEFGHQEVDDMVVKVLTTEEGITIGGLDFEHSLLDLQNRNIEGAATQIVNGNAER